MLFSVLWIRIRKKVQIRIQKLFYSKLKISVKKSQNKHLKEKYRYVPVVDLLETFFLCRTASRTYIGMKEMRGTIVKNFDSKY
jgi:hypothetical protein